eukprot:6174403-Pleurochrysis_carterae.AAC.2
MPECGPKNLETKSNSPSPGAVATTLAHILSNTGVNARIAACARKSAKAASVNVAADMHPHRCTSAG